MTVVELRGVHKTYDVGQAVVRALRGITLDFAAGEFVAIAGPSGSGKSTLLNVVAMLDEPNQGTLRIGGNDVTLLSDDDRTELRNQLIGFVFQRFNLVPVLSALENVMLPLELRGLGQAECRQRALAMLRDVGLGDFVGHRPDHLSGGQQQRVAVARALVIGPAIVVADEPTANLDSETSKHIIGLMRLLNRQHGTTFIFSTHDNRLLGHVDRLIHLTDGQVVERNAVHDSGTEPRVAAVLS
jgi:putative ABC transport system ATP-binding protein